MGHFLGQVVFIFGVRSSSFFGSGRLHFLGQVVFTFWVRSSSLFGSGRLHFLGQVVFTVWVRSSLLFWSGRLHFLGGFAVLSMTSSSTSRWLTLLLYCDLQFSKVKKALEDLSASNILKFSFFCKIFLMSSSSKAVSAASASSISWTVESGFCRTELRLARILTLSVDLV